MCTKTSLDNANRALVPNFPTVNAIAPNAPIGATRIIILIIPKNTIIALSKASNNWMTAAPHPN